MCFKSGLQLVAAAPVSTHLTRPWSAAPLDFSRAFVSTRANTRRARTSATSVHLTSPIQTAAMSKPGKVIHGGSRWGLLLVWVLQSLVRTGGGHTLDKFVLSYVCAVVRTLFSHIPFRQKETIRVFTLVTCGGRRQNF